MLHVTDGLFFVVRHACMHDAWHKYKLWYLWFNDLPTIWFHHLTNIEHACMRRSSDTLTRTRSIIVSIEMLYRGDCGGECDTTLLHLWHAVQHVFIHRGQCLAHSG